MTSMPIALPTRAAVAGLVGSSAALGALKIKPTLSPDAAVAQDPKTHANGISPRPKFKHVSPLMLLLPLNEHLLLV